MKESSVCGPWRLAVSLLVGAAVTLAGAPGLAQPQNDVARDVALEGDETARAKELFKEASALRDDGDLEGARRLLQQAIDLKETPGLRFHLADVLERLGRKEQALAEYERAATLIEEGQPAPDVQKLLGPAIERMKVAVAAGSTGSTAAVDPSDRSDGAPRPEHAKGASQSSTPEPGDGSRGRRAETSRAKSGREGRRASRERPAPDRELPSHDGAETGGIGARELVLASEAGVAILAVGFGVLQSIEAGRADDSAAENRREVERLDPADDAPADDASADDASANKKPPCLEPQQELEDACRALGVAIEDRDRARTLALVGYVVGGAAAVSFVATLLLWPTAEPGDTARIGVMLAPSGGGVSVGGVF